MARATISVEAHSAKADLPDRGDPATVRVGDVRAWIDGKEARAFLRGHTTTCGIIELQELVGELYVDLEGRDRAGADVYSMLTVTSALVLGRMGHVLIHAGAVTDSRGGSWLVVGDARSGKSTTCVSLAACGFGLLSDDQVVLGPSRDAVHVEGWLRPLHLDDGWDRRIPTGTRHTILPSALGRWNEAGVARVAGTIHTTIQPDAPTSATALSAADVFTRLVRQSPWLLADRDVAPEVIRTLSRIASLPRLLLRLGRDTFGRPERLRALLPIIPY